MSHQQLGRYPRQLLHICEERLQQLYDEANATREQYEDESGYAMVSSEYEMRSVYTYGDLVGLEDQIASLEQMRREVIADALDDDQRVAVEAEIDSWERAGLPRAEARGRVLSDFYKLRALRLSLLRDGPNAEVANLIQEFRGWAVESVWIAERFFAMRPEERKAVQRKRRAKVLEERRRKLGPLRRREFCASRSRLRTPVRNRTCKARSRSRRPRRRVVRAASRSGGGSSGSSEPGGPSGPPRRQFPHSDGVPLRATREDRAHEGVGT